MIYLRRQKSNKEGRKPAGMSKEFPAEKNVLERCKQEQEIQKEHRDAL